MVTTFRAMMAAFAARDADEYVSHLADDVVFSPPGIMLGRRELHGREEVRAGFAELAQVLDPGRELDVGGHRGFVDRADEDRLLVVVEITISPDVGEPYGTQAALLLTMTGDKVSRFDSLQTEAEGLAQLTDPVAIEL